MVINLQTLPVVLAYETIFPHSFPLPSAEIRVDIREHNTQKLIETAAEYQNQFVILMPKEPDKVHLLQRQLSEHFYKNFTKTVSCQGMKSFSQHYHETAVIAKVSNMAYLTKSICRVKIDVVDRVHVNDIHEENGLLTVDFTVLSSVISDYEKAEKCIATLRRLRGIKTIGHLEYEQIIEKTVAQNDFRSGSDLLATWLICSYDEKLELLQTLDVTKRLELLVKIAKNQVLFTELDRKIEDNVKKSINESQKEYYLREKIKAIQDELGDRVKKEADIEMLREKIKNKNLPERMKEIALKELNRYNSSSSNTPETGIIRTYLDFILNLPWGTFSEDTDNIAVAQAELDREHYGLTKVKNRILEYLAVKIMTGKNPQTILCLVGPPGVGKTSLAHSIASSLNRSFVKQALGGVHDESEIRGHRRTYIGALPGRILQGMAKSGTNNPVFLLDEVDKMTKDYKGDPTSAMLEVLDTEQNRFFSDHYLEEPYDLSKVLFICTANYLENIPAPLRDRLEIVELSSYTEYEKFEIAKRHLVKKQLSIHGLSEDNFSISDQTIYSIIQKYTREAGVRELERHLGGIIRKCVKNILMDKIERIDVNVDMLEELLGKPRYNRHQIDENDQIGVVTGLAYTQYGGDTLPVEVTYYAGKGNFVLTGQLGDVMKESAQAALSYVKSAAKIYNIDVATFATNDIHIHIPDGAVPKDGPSAGITIATALISALSGKKVNHLIGMTGEINLRGRVMAIGGLREKSIAAHRSGLKTILIPRENIRDLDEVPESVRNNLNIIPVSSIEEVVDYVIIKN